ncbi:MAG TPA: molybdenum cofactor guanylyltransferase [Pyrinomonadaceae bacterium]|nr:molybdenum cofactor guanylyltransferase [Pyrinomonadaceae bacterium]
MNHSSLNHAYEGMDAFILAGGESRRMGTDKSQLVLDGSTLVERIAAVLRSITPSIRVVGREIPNSPLQSVPDVYSKWGALGGVHAALAACTTDWAVVIACDMPNVTQALLSRMADLRNDFEAVAPIQPDDRPQPLCAFYRKAPCLETAKKLIESGERKPVTLLQSVRTRWVSFNELRDLPSADLLFENMNTPEDYLRAQSKGADLQ